MITCRLKPTSLPGTSRHTVRECINNIFHDPGYTAHGLSAKYFKITLQLDVTAGLAMRPNSFNIVRVALSALRTNLRLLGLNDCKLALRFNPLDLDSRRKIYKGYASEIYLTVYVFLYVPDVKKKAEAILTIPAMFDLLNNDYNQVFRRPLFDGLDVYEDKGHRFIYQTKISY